MQCIGLLTDDAGNRRCRGGAERGFRTCPPHRSQEHNEQAEFDFTGSLSTELPPYQPSEKYDALMAELQANIKRLRKTR